MANFKVNIKATNYDLNPDIRNYINHQISKFEKVLPTNTEEIILDVEVGKKSNHHNRGPVFLAEFNMKYKDEFKRAVETKEDLKTALDLAADDMVRQIREAKEKKTDLTRKGANRLKQWLRLGK